VELAMGLLQDRLYNDNTLNKGMEQTGYYKDKEGKI